MDKHRDVRKIGELSGTLMKAQEPFFLALERFGIAVGRDLGELIFPRHRGPSFCPWLLRDLQ
jgi:hypothetical protein